MIQYNVIKSMWGYDVLITEINNNKDVEPMVTIGMCAKNTNTIIEDAIMSIINQDYPKYLMETIFVDDGSEDNTLEIIIKYALQMNMSIKIFSHEWEGLGPSRNLIVNESKGKYIVWIDADEIISKDMVRKQVEFMENNPTVGIAKGTQRILKDANLVSSLEMMYQQTTHILDRENNLLPLGTGASIYRVAAIRDVGGFDNSIKGVGEDMELEDRIKKIGWASRRTTAVFYEKARNSWEGLWRQYYWHGFGGPTLFTKNVLMHNDAQNIFFPFIKLREEVYRSIFAFKITKQKRAFLLVFHWIFKRIAWLLGYLRARTHKS